MALHDPEHLKVPLTQLRQLKRLPGAMLILDAHYARHPLDWKKTP
ncbi:hypothetical protein [Janthinobacterium sp. RB2R34]